MVSCQKGPTRHVYAWQIRPFWQDTLDIVVSGILLKLKDFHQLRGKWTHWWCDSIQLATVYDK